MTSEFKLSPLLSRKQVANILGVDARTLDRQVREGKFPAPAYVLGRPRWDTNVVKTHIANRLRAVGQL